LIWSLSRTRSLEQELDTKGRQLAFADSLVKDADDARWYAERLRDKADGVLEDLLRLHPELERSRKQAEAERNLALLHLVEARTQEQAKQVALEGERSARVDEAVQRKVAEERADSLAREKRRTDNLNLQQNSSRAAQNSMAVKGRPEFRGLMAVYALRSMEQAGGAVNKDELIRALGSAVEELERPSPVRVSGFKRAPHQLMHGQHDRELLALGHDGILHRVDMRQLSSSPVADYSRSLEPGIGRSFVSSDLGALVLTDQKGDIAAYATTGDQLIARSRSGSDSENVRAVAVWPGLKVVVTGDAKGNVQAWRKEANVFKPLEPRTMGAAIKGMAYDASADRVVVVAATGPALILAADGTVTELRMPAGQSARCLAPAGNGILFIGTEQGAILRMDLKAARVTVFHEGGGRRVEVLAAAPGAARLAYVNAVKELIVLDATTAPRSVRILLEAIPGAMAIGVEDEIYIAFNDRVERVFCTSRSMADRICELIGRNWSPAEWSEIGESGTPEPTCGGF
jgi:hypothetical protein